MNLFRESDQEAAKSDMPQHTLHPRGCGLANILRIDDKDPGYPAAQIENGKAELEAFCGRPRQVKRRPSAHDPVSSTQSEYSL